jgi:hypothetical protein
VTLATRFQKILGNVVNRTTFDAADDMDRGVLAELKPSIRAKHTIRQSVTNLDSARTADAGASGG